VVACVVSQLVTQLAGAQNTADLPAPTADAPAPAGPADDPAQRHSLLTAIDVEPGATCLAADKLIRRVERWLNQTKVDARIRVHVRGDESEATKVVFSIDRGDGQPPAVRRIDDAPAECEQLHSALALSIALAIDASILGGDGPIELPDDEELLGSEQPSETEPEYLRVAAAVLGQLNTGLLTSDIALGAAVRIEVGFMPWLDLRVGGLFATAGGQRVGGIPGTYDASLLAARGDVCGATAPAEGFRFLACGSYVLGEFRTVGHAYTGSSDEASSLWSAGGGGVEVQAEPIDRLAFALSVDLLIPFARRTILVLDRARQPVASRDLSSVGVVIGLGAVFRVF
jgi:hypothetical protein